MTQPTPKQRKALYVKFKAAWVSLIEAAMEMDKVYGNANEHSKQLRGAAKMISDDWIPEIRGDKK